MGSATREAIARARTALAGLDAVDPATGEQLLAAGRAIGDASHLRAALADPAAPADAKRGLVNSVFASLGTQARELLGTLVAGRWSSADEMVAGIEELGFRALAASAPADVDLVAELIAFRRAVDSSPELELALGSKLGDVEAKARLVRQLLAGKASRQVTAVVEQLVRQPRGRRIGAMLRRAAAVIADQSGALIANVTVATALTADQRERLQTGLGRQYGRPVRVNEIVDPTVIGGLRVQIGDDVIDGTLASRLQDLRLQLAR